MQTNDTANVGNRLLMEGEAKAFVRSECKPSKLLSTKDPVSFNGANISGIESDVHVSHTFYIRKLSVVNCISVEKSSFIAERARGAHIVAVSRPDLFFGGFSLFTVCAS